MARLRVLAEAQSSQDESTNNFYKHAEWTPDGTSLLTNSVDNHVRTYIVPPDLLEERPRPLRIEPYSTIPSATPVNAVTCYPHFDLDHPQWTLILSAPNDEPIRLSSALTGQKLAAFPLINTYTEAYTRVHALTFSNSGASFVAGTSNRLSIFDVSRSGEGPTTTRQTGPRTMRSPWSNPTTALRGIISALAVEAQQNLLAAGTLDRQIGIYASAGQGECSSLLFLSGTEATRESGGSGITQVCWSSCGRHLYVAERKSDGITTFDIRKMDGPLSWASGRKAQTNQRMNFQLVHNDIVGSDELWAGGTDGKVRCWTNLTHEIGSVPPAQEIDICQGNVLHLLCEVL